MTRVRMSAIGAAGVCAGIGILILGSGPALYRVGALALAPATAGVQTSAEIVFAIGLVLALVGLVMSALARRSRGVILGIVLSVVCGYGVGRLYAYGEMRTSLPPLNDVQTDWGKPVAFSQKVMAEREAAKAAPLRDGSPLSGDVGKWAGKSSADMQAEVYEVKPLLVGVKPAEATRTVENAMKELDWTVISSDPQTGVVEGVHRSTWYDLVADIAVRVIPQGEGSRIDVRSTSRAPGSDMGANATRIKSLLDTVYFDLRGSGEPAPLPEVQVKKD